MSCWGAAAAGPGADLPGSLQGHSPTTPMLARLPLKAQLFKGIFGFAANLAEAQRQREQPAAEAKGAHYSSLFHLCFKDLPVCQKPFPLPSSPASSLISSPEPLVLRQS